MKQYYYPELTNPNFNNIINNKKEFQKYNLKNTQGKQKPKKLIEFIKSPTQKLLANYINTKTPYNGLLIWHSVGVGKTCTAISIAENFRDLALQSKQKILILTPGQKLKQSWLKEIFNSDRQNKVKLSSNVNVQCTEDYYTKKYKQLRKKYNSTQSQRKIEKLIQQIYELKGYQELVNFIDKGVLNPNYNYIKHSELKLIAFLRKNFQTK